MQFHKLWQLVGEAHEEEISKLQHKHAEDLWAVEEEARNLREQILFLEALLPKEYRGRVPRLHYTEIGNNGKISTQQSEEVVLPKACAGIEIDTSNAPSRKEELMQLCIESLRQPGYLSTSDIQVETKFERYVHPGPSSRYSNHCMPATLNDATELILEESSCSQCSDGHDTDRALSNWLSIGLIVQVATCSGASRLHPAWHNSISRLKSMIDDSVSLGCASDDSGQSLTMLASVCDSIIEDSGMADSKEFITKTSRFVRMTQRTSFSITTTGSWKQFFDHNQWILDPSSRQKVLWDFCSLLWCANDFVIFPLQFVESADFGTFEDSRTLLAAIFWTIDMFVTLSTGYYTADASVEMRRWNITTHYIKSWFMFDIIVLLPDWVSVFFSTQAMRLGILKMTRMLRMVRLMRAVRLLPKLWECVGQHNSEQFVTVAHLLQHMIVMILINHYFACFVLATWIELDSQDSFVHMYLQGLHWALAHSTLGNMDINPSTLFQRLWTCLTLMLSMVLFSYFLSNITNAVIHLGSLTEERRTKKIRVRQFFSENQVSRRLAGQIWNYVWRRENDLGSKTRLNEVKLFEGLPKRMRAELHYQIFLPHLLVHPLFSSYNVMEPKALVMLCSRGIEQVYLPPGAEMPVKARNTLDKMVFVNSGSLLYQPYGSPPSNAVVVQCNMWMGEEALWAMKAKIQGVLSAGLRGSDVMLILPEEFRAMASTYSASMPFLISYGQTFIKRFNAACAGDNSMNDGDILFNDPFMIKDFIHSARWAMPRFSRNTKKSIVTKAFM